MIEKTLDSANKDENPLRWAKLMNMKGILLMDMARFKEAEDAFNKSISSADELLKCKIFISYAKLNYFTKDLNKASMLINRVFEIAKANKKLRLENYLGYAHMLKGQTYYASADPKKALNEFKQAEHYFEGTADLRGVGLSCMEIARIHIKNKNLTTAWNYLKKSENCLSKAGSSEKLGVAVCKGVALFYAGKEDEAEIVLKRAYSEGENLGKGNYMLYEILDAYLDTRSRMLQYQKALM